MHLPLNSIVLIGHQLTHVLVNSFSNKLLGHVLTHEDVSKLRNF